MIPQEFQQMRSIKQEVLSWNTKYPFDFIWRLKNKVIFGSPQHRAMNFMDMRFQLLEENIYENVRISLRIKERYKNSLLIERVSKFSEKEMDDAFDDLDISKM